MLTKADGKPVRGNHQRGFGRARIGDAIALRVDEASRQQEAIRLVEIIYVHTDCRHGLGQGYVGDVQVKSILVFHPYRGDVGVVDILFVMALLKTEFLEQSDDLACVFGQNDGIKGCDFHAIPP